MSFEVQNTVTATEADAAAIVSRDASVEEIAATDAIQNAAIDAAVSLEDYTTRVVVVAIGAHDRATFNGVSAIALRLCMRQAKVTAGNGLYSPETDEFILNSVYFDAALAGKQIFRNTKDATDSADMVAAIVAARDAGDMDTARKLAREYVMVWGKGKKLVKGLALLRQDGMRLATYMRDHAADAINVCASLTGDHRLAAQTWRKSVLSRMGDTYVSMTDKLESLYSNKAKGSNKGPAKAKATAPVETAPVETDTATVQPFVLSNDATDADRIAAIFDIVEALSADGFAALVERINLEAAARAAAPIATVEAETVTDAEFSEVAPDAQVSAPMLAIAGPVATVEAAPVAKPKRGNRKAATGEALAA